LRGKLPISCLLESREKWLSEAKQRFATNLKILRSFVSKKISDFLAYAQNLDRLKNKGDIENGTKR
jgi:hypothetical protein